MLFNKVFPAKCSKWPGNCIERTQTIFIQQDNAKPHIAIDGSEFMVNAS